MNVGRLSLENIEKCGEVEFLKFGDRTLSNVELDRNAARLATVLQSHGVKANDNVMIVMPNSPDVIAAFQAVWKIGAVIIPVTPMLTAREIGYMLANSDARVAITSPVLAGRVREAAEGVKGFELVRPEVCSWLW